MSVVGPLTLSEHPSISIDLVDEKSSMEERLKKVDGVEDADHHDATETRNGIRSVILFRVPKLNRE